MREKFPCHSSLSAGHGHRPPRLLPLDRVPLLGSIVACMANVLESVTETIKTLGVRASYGEPVVLDGVEVVPVALVSFGFGASGGDKEGGGEGGGGGASVPIGAYISGPAGPVFHPEEVDTDR
jgi:hypothetical protein